MHIAPPPSSESPRQLHRAITGYTGLDLFLGMLPEQMQANAVAKRIWKHHGSPVEFASNVFSFTLPGGGQFFVAKVNGKVIAKAAVRS